MNRNSFSPLPSLRPQPNQAQATIDCVDPATGAHLGQRSAASADEVRAAIQRAKAAQLRWQTTSFDARRRVLKTLLQRLLERTDEMCQLISQDAGKTREHALIGEIWPVAEKLRWTIAHGQKYLEPEPVATGPLIHKRAWIEYQPLGVIGVIAPWNFPLQNILGPTIPALFAGNAVIVKVSEWVAWSAQTFADLVANALEANGHDADLVQVIAGYADAGAALVSGGVDKIVFTGSVNNGRHVIRESADSLTPVILELGGKDAMIVCDDADLERTVQLAAAGCFMNAGQMCLATERILVHQAVHDRFVARATELAHGLRIGASERGPGPDVGALTTPFQRDIVHRLVDDAVTRGAKLHTGGEIPPGPGNFYPPTVLSEVRADMQIMQEETFGPVMAIARVEDDEHAIAMANATGFGLSSSVFTRNAERARNIAKRLRAGSTCVNDFGLAYMANELPFGGVGDSGFGRLNGREGLRACTNVKSVIVDRWNFSAPTRIFPTTRHDYGQTKALLRAAYGANIEQRFGGALALGQALWRRVMGSRED